MKPAVSIASEQTPEAEFILLCLRDPSATGETRLKQLLQSNLDWPCILTWGRRHGVLPLVYHRLKDSCWEHVPSAPGIELEEFVRKNAAKNLGAAAELMQLLKTAREHSIEVVPFKGVVLSQQLYGNYAMRVANDLDLLVRPSDVPRLKDLLARRDYAACVPLADNYSEELLRSEGQISLTQKRRPWVVELHTSLLIGPDAQATTLDSLNPRLEPSQINGEPFRTLSPEDLLLYLCAHGAKHWWERLSWICDVAQLMRIHPDLDWGSIQRRARELRWERAFLLGLALAHKLLGTPVPNGIHLHQPVISQLTESVAKTLFATSAVRRNTLHRIWFQLRCRERPRDRIFLAWYVLLQPKIADWRVVSLPARLSRLHFLFRPVRLAGKYGRQLVHRLWSSTIPPEEIK